MSLTYWPSKNNAFNLKALWGTYEWAYMPTFLSRPSHTTWITVSVFSYPVDIYMLVWFYHGLDFEYLIPLAVAIHWSQQIPLVFDQSWALLWLDHVLMVDFLLGLAYPLPWPFLFHGFFIFIFILKLGQWIKSRSGAEEKCRRYCWYFETLGYYLKLLMIC